MAVTPDPDDMSPDARRVEVAVLLAVGYLRQRQHAGKPVSPADKPLDSSTHPILHWTTG